MVNPGQRKRKSLCSKRITFQFRVNSKRKGNPSSLTKAVAKLTRFMFRRIRQLTSTRHYPNYMTKKIKIVLKRPISSSRIQKLKKIYRKRIPVITDKREKPMLQFWHELSKKRFKYKILQACSKIPRRHFIAAQYIALEATEFVPCNFHKSIYGIDPKEEEEAFETLKQHNLIPSLDELYMPSTVDFEEFILTGELPKSNKIPIIGNASSTKSISTDSPRQQRQEQPQKGFHNQDKQFKESQGKWRQTTIEEYFKPRRLMITDDSEGPQKRQKQQ